MQMRREDRSLSDLFVELTQDLSSLIRQEVQLAQAELKQSAMNIGKNAGFMAAGGFVLLSAWFALLAALIAGISRSMPVWAAALIVGVVLAIIGGALAFIGYNALKHANVVPQRTIETVKDTTNQVREQLR